MSLNIIYEYECDNCGCGITHVPYRLKTKEDYNSWGVIHFRGKDFCCEECRIEYFGK